MPRPTDLYNPPLQVIGFVATRRGDEERGPAIRLNRAEATLRMLTDGDGTDSVADEWDAQQSRTRPAVPSNEAAEK